MGEREGYYCPGKEGGSRERKGVLRPCTGQLLPLSFLNEGKQLADSYREGPNSEKVNHSLRAALLSMLISQERSNIHISVGQKYCSSGQPPNPTKAGEA